MQRKQLIDGKSDLLLSGGVVLRTGLVEGPLVIGVIVHPLAKMVSEVKTPEGKNKLHHNMTAFWKPQE